MKITKILITLIFGFFLISSTNTVHSDKVAQDFYVYNTIIDYQAKSEFSLVLNRSTKNVKYNKNANTITYPASLTKIMTALVAIENIENMDEVVAIDVDTYFKMLAQSSSMAGFKVNEKVTYWDLLYGTLLSSGGEAANSLAVNISGNTQDFVKLMNNKAKELEMNNSNFTNAEGLHAKNHYTTANDMVLLLDYALDNYYFKKVFTTPKYQTTETPQHPEGISLYSTVFSQLEDLDNNSFEIIGGKSGYTPQAGRCWATLGIKNNVEYISVVMGAYPLQNTYSTKIHIEDTIEIFDHLNESND